MDVTFRIFVDGQYVNILDINKITGDFTWHPLAKEIIYNDKVWENRYPGNRIVLKKLWESEKLPVSNTIENLIVQLTDVLEYCVSNTTASDDEENALALVKKSREIIAKTNFNSFASHRDIESLLGLEAAISGIKFDHSVPVISEQYINTLLETMQPMFEVAKDLPPIITKLQTNCKHRLVKHWVDPTTPVQKCIDCSTEFEIYNMRPEEPSGDFMEISSPERK